MAAAVNGMRQNMKKRISERASLKLELNRAVQLHNAEFERNRNARNFLQKERQNATLFVEKANVCKNDVKQVIIELEKWIVELTNEIDKVIEIDELVKKINLTNTNELTTFENKCCELLESLFYGQVNYNSVKLVETLPKRRNCRNEQARKTEILALKHNNLTNEFANLTVLEQKKKATNGDLDIDKSDALSAPLTARRMFSISALRGQSTLFTKKEKVAALRDEIITLKELAVVVE